MMMHGNTKIKNQKINRNLDCQRQLLSSDSNIIFLQW